MTSPPIAAHRLLGDGSSTALLRPAGEVDWWCAPEMDDPPLLWSLLDPDGAAARWCGVRLAGSAGRAAGPVLSTVLQSPRGRLECRDALHCADDRGSSLVRLVRAVDGDLDLEHELALGGFDQGWASWSGSTATVAGRTVRVLGGSSEPHGRWLRTRVRAPRGEWAALVVTLDPERTGDVADLLADLAASTREDEALLARAWLPSHGRQRCADALRVLRLCTYARTGAVVAAPTTSLPEAPGHDRQFDYRYTWLRDASLAVSVAALLGRRDMAEDYLRFVLGQTRERRMPSGPMTDVRGEEVPEEREVPGVAGWGGSLPVRVGNAARDQLQYDALGLLVEAVSLHLQEGGRCTDEVWDLVRSVADRLAADGLEPRTSGIWELREPAELVSADIGIWVALDRAVWIARGWRPTARRTHWKRARRAAARQRPSTSAVRRSRSGGVEGVPLGTRADMSVLQGQVALVTGGGTGIGAEVCARLARDGAAVAVNGRSSEEVDGVVARCRALGVQAVPAIGDVSRADDVERIVQGTVDQLGRLTIAVNNAGFQVETPVLELDLETWRSQLAVNLDGAFLVAQAAARQMAGRGGGTIINVTSVHEHQPRPGFAAYCVSKAGLGMLTKVMARELAPQGIRVVSVAPGAIETAMQGEQTPQEREEQLAGIPAGRLAQPAEVAALVAWLVSPEAAYVSGTSVVIDGALETQVSLA